MWPLQSRSRTLDHHGVTPLQSSESHSSLRFPESQSFYSPTVCLMQSRLALNFTQPKMTWHFQSPCLHFPSACHTPPCSLSCWAGDACMLGKHSTNWATFPAFHLCNFVTLSVWYKWNHVSCNIQRLFITHEEFVHVGRFSGERYACVVSTGCPMQKKNGVERTRTESEEVMKKADVASSWEMTHGLRGWGKTRVKRVGCILKRIWW